MELPPALLRRDEPWEMLIATSRIVACLVQEQAVFGVLNNPSQAFLEVLARHGAARHDPPLVRVNAV